jgi:uncharacterized membrane protein
MDNINITLEELFEHPQIKNTLTGDEKTKIYFECQKDSSAKKDPLYIRILSGVGAWFSAVFLLIFFYMADIIEQNTSAIVIGIILFIAAIFLNRVNKRTFLNQLALALAMTGNSLIMFGSSNSIFSFSYGTITLIQLVICLVTYPFFNNTVYRYLSPILTALLATGWVVKGNYPYYLHVLIGIETLLFGILIIQKKRSDILSPLIYSTASLLPATILFINLSQMDLWGVKFNTSLLASNIIITAALVCLFIYLAGGIKRLREPWLILAIATSILLAVFTTPGILVAVGLLVLGYNYDDFLLSGLAYIFMPVFLGWYYYTLNVDLAYKSFILAGSGLILIIVRWIANYFLRPGKEAI